MSKVLKYRIVEFKEMNNLTYRKIATFCHVTERQVVSWAKYEKDSPKSMSGDSLFLLSQLFSCPMEALLTKEDLVPA